MQINQRVLNGVTTKFGKRAPCVRASCTSPSQRSVPVLAAGFVHAGQRWRSQPTAAHADSTTGQQQQHSQLREELKHGTASMTMLAAATIQQGASTTAEIYLGLAKAVDIYLVVLTVRVLLSWFKQINWYTEPFNTLSQLTDPYLNVFRGILPAIQGIDLSPMLGFIALQFLRNVLVGMVSGAYV